MSRLGNRGQRFALVVGAGLLHHASMARFARDAIPHEVLEACRTLQQAGFSAYVVGGAVRDLLRKGAGAKDFDLTTSARPEQVLELFGKQRTIPTGLQHGTVTVLCAAGSGPPRPVEITTFRGEIGFSDGRRPDRVEFISDLVEDLRRRDFTINAIAYDPFGGGGGGGDGGDGVLVDPFGGQADLERRCIRAVGDPAARFGEDGLRVLRAVRFAAQLGFTVEAATRDAFAGALPTLRKVSRERVRDELQKLLRSSQPSQGLRLMFERSEHEADWGPEGSLLRVVLPEVAASLHGLAAAQRWARIIDAADPEQRLAAALWPMRDWLDGPGERVRYVPRALPELLDERLKLPASERDHLAALLLAEPLDAGRYVEAEAPALRRLLAARPRCLLDDLIALQRLYTSDPVEDGPLRQLAERLAAVRAENPPLSTGELAVTGKDLLGELGLRPGPLLGILLRQLLDEVLEDPARNTKPQLLRRARELQAQQHPGS
jgi:tRNA nucleotidyltransferase (CCA-adding enzyme)